MRLPCRLCRKSRTPRGPPDNPVEGRPRAEHKRNAQRTPAQAGYHQTPVRALRLAGTLAREMSVRRGARQVADQTPGGKAAYNITLKHGVSVILGRRRALYGFKEPVRRPTGG